MLTERIKEIWADIVGFDSYEVSNKGKIRRKHHKIFIEKTKREMNLKKRLMKQRWNKTCKTYFLDLMNSERKRKTVYPHKEVAKAFCVNNNPEKLTMIIHLDNNPKNNTTLNKRKIVVLLGMTIFLNE